MKERNVWRYLFIGLGILFLLTCAVFISRVRAEHKNADLRQRYIELRKSYLNLAKEYRKDLDVLARNESVVAKSWAEEHELTERAFGDAVRRKMIRLELECEALESQGTDATPTPNN